ncbi:unnamed protein product, partial [Polarella glacialis]
KQPCLPLCSLSNRPSGASVVSVCVFELHCAMPCFGKAAESSGASAVDSSPVKQQRVESSKEEEEERLREMGERKSTKAAVDLQAAARGRVARASVVELQL